MKLFGASLGNPLTHRFLRGGAFLAAPVAVFVLARPPAPHRSAAAPPELQAAQAAALAPAEATAPAAPEIPTQATANRMMELQSQLQEAVRDAPARMASVYVQDIGSGLTAAANPDEDHLAASLIKLPVMGAVYEKWEAAPERKTRTTRTWMEWMITVSDNASTDRLIDLVNGPEVVTRFCSERGWDDLKVRHAILNHRGRRGLNQCTARQVGEFLAALDRRELVSEEADEEMWQVLCRSRKLLRIPAGVPDSPEFLVGNKTGSLSNALHDAAIVRTPRTQYAVCILLSGQRGETRGNRFCRDVSRLIFETLHGPIDTSQTVAAR